MLGVILYFNTIALIYYQKNLEIKVLNTADKCSYNNQNLAKALKCLNSVDQYFSNNGLLYSLDIVPKQYTEICNSLCKNNVDSSGNCQLENSQQYDSCVSLLKPDDKCYNEAEPVAYDDENRIYYANEILTNNC